MIFAQLQTQANGLGGGAGRESWKGLPDDGQK
jgi:hypothetical protein